VADGAVGLDALVEDGRHAEPGAVAHRRFGVALEGVLGAEDYSQLLERTDAELAAAGRRPAKMDGVLEEDLLAALEAGDALAEPLPAEDAVADHAGDEEAPVERPD